MEASTRRRREAPPAIEALAGAFSGGLARMIVAPLDVLKIRFQLQVEPVNSRGGRYTSMLQATRLLVAEEGLRTLWRGNVAAMSLWILYTAVQFPAYRVCKEWLEPRIAGSDANSASSTRSMAAKVVPSLLAGGLSGAFATTVTYPLDWIRTRWASQGIPKVYHSMQQLVTTEYAMHGWRVFFQGLSPTLISVTPQLAMTFLMYERCLHWIEGLRDAGYPINDDVRAATAGAMAGTMGKLVVYPLDTVKKRLQVTGMQRSESYGAQRQYRGMLHALVTISREEGIITGLFKGTAPSLAKAAAAAAVTFTAYEAAKRSLMRYTDVPDDDGSAPSATRNTRQ